MKYVLIIVALFYFSTAQAQTIFAPMRDAIKSGNVPKLAKYFNAPINLNLDGEANTYTKAQAEIKLQEFFKKHTPSDFTIIHTGSSKAGLQFAIGKFKSGNNNFDVLVRVREVEKVYLIHEMSFTKE